MNDILHNVRFLIFGDSGVGKTAIINRIICHSFTDKYLPTAIPEMVSKSLYIDGESLKLNIWGIPSKEFSETDMPTFPCKNDCCIFIYDSTNPASFESIKKWYNMFTTRLEEKQKISLFQNDKINFVLLGNKSDLPNKSVDPSSARKFAQENGNMLFYEVSAKKNDSSFDEIIKKVLEKALNKEFKIHSSVVWLPGSEDEEEEMNKNEREDVEENLAHVIQYVRFLERRLGLYEEVTPISMEAIMKMIEEGSIEIEMKRNNNENCEKRKSETRSFDSDKNSDKDDTDKIIKRIISENNNDHTNEIINKKIIDNDKYDTGEIIDKKIIKNNNEYINEIIERKISDNNTNDTDQIIENNNEYTDEIVEIKISDNYANDTEQIIEKSNDDIDEIIERRISDNDKDDDDRIERRFVDYDDSDVIAGRCYVKVLTDDVMDDIKQSDDDVSDSEIYNEMTEKFDIKKIENATFVLLNYAHFLEERLNKHEYLNQIDFNASQTFFKKAKP